MNDPIKVASIAEFLRLPDERVSTVKHDWGHFKKATMYLLSYVDAEFADVMSRDQRDQFIVKLVNGKTPNDVIILGYMIRLSEVRRLDVGERKESETVNDEAYLRNMVMEYVNNR